MGMRGSPTAELAFDGVRVPAANRIGEEGAGFGLAMRTFDRSRPGIAAQAVGIAQGALDVATAYARDRSSSASGSATSRWSRRCWPTWTPPPSPPASSCTRRASRSRPGRPTPAGGRRCVNSWPGMPRCVSPPTPSRCSGGYGYIDEFPVERMMRDAKLTQLYEGTQQIQRLVVARALLGKDD